MFVPSFNRRKNLAARKKEILLVKTRLSVRRKAFDFFKFMNKNFDRSFLLKEKKIMKNTT